MISMCPVRFAVCNPQPFSMQMRTHLVGPLALMLAATLACRSESQHRRARPLEYIGSSTIAHAMHAVNDAEIDEQIDIDDQAESVGGEEAILTGQCDLAGYAGTPSQRVVKSGLEATWIGDDAIAVVVSTERDLNGLSIGQLRSIFSGEIEDWEQIDGAGTGRIKPLIVDRSSVTRKVFRAAVLGVRDYAGCEVVAPDAKILARVAEDPNSIGQISASFPFDDKRVRVLAIDGVRATDRSGEYPITRPLYLLWWPGRERVARLVSWLESPAGQSLLHDLYRITPSHTEGS
ncbi:MAG: ABC-type phosphate transport system substrate-binding protein [Planctomycetota bacterium]|jgi:ABC-type phosphate transport system substrate-binding protein